MRDRTTRVVSAGIVGFWLLACLPWLPALVGTEFAGWRRFFAQPGGIFPARYSELDNFFEDVRETTPTGCRITLVSEHLPVDAEVPTTYLFLYPRHLRWALAADGFDRAAADADFVALTSTRPLRVAPGADDVRWLHTYPATRMNPAFQACLMRGDQTPIPQASQRPTPPKFLAGLNPLRTVAGFLAYGAAVMCAGFVLIGLFLPRCLNGLEQTGLALLLGFLFVPALLVGLMTLGLPLRLGFAMLLAAIAVAGLFRFFLPRVRNGPPAVTAANTPPCPWWLLLPAGLLAARTVLTGLIPVYSWDTWMIWLLKTRVLWIDNGLNGPFWKWLDDLWESHPAYPLAWPSAGALAGLLTGGPDAYVVNWAWQAILLGGLLMACGAALRLAGPRVALVTALAALCFPQIWNSNDFGLADVPLAATAFAAAAYLAAAWRGGDARLFALSAVAALLGAAVKMEGLVILAAWLVAAALLWGRSRRLRSPQTLVVAGVALLLLAWYTVPVLRHFPDERWRNAAPMAWQNNLRRVPEFAAAFGRELFNLRLPSALTAPELPPGAFWHPDEFLFAGSSVRFLHLPLLAGLLLLGLLRTRRPWRTWLPLWLFPGLLLLLYPLLYVPMPKDLTASIPRLSLHLVAVLAAAILATWPILAGTAGVPSRRPPDIS